MAAHNLSRKEGSDVPRDLLTYLQPLGDLARQEEGCWGMRRNIEKEMRRKITKVKKNITGRDFYGK